MKSKDVGAVAEIPAPPTTRSLAPKTILVTGGAGFIGSNFVPAIYTRYPSYRIVVLDALTYAGNLDYLRGIERDERFEFHYGDIRNRSLVDRLVSEADVVVHFAAESHVSRSIADSSSCVSTDVVGTDTVAGAIVQYQDRIERFIHISSSEVYGTAYRDTMDEEHPLNPCSPYAAAKAGADRLVYAYYYTYGIPAVIVRPFNNYGPHQHLEKLVPRLITSCLLGESMPIHGDGNAARDWIYVGDNCDAIDAVLHAPQELVVGETFNIGTGRATSIREIAELVSQKFGGNSGNMIHVPERPGQVSLHRADVSKIERVLGVRCKTSLSKGLDETIAWYVANRDIWQRQLWLRNIEIRTATGSFMH
jgi:dTDP-glucose 4,6-dehydratase